MLNTFIGLLIGHGDEVEVPDLAGITVERARERLRAQSLTLTIKSERASNAFEAGKIVTQHPKPLARVKPGRRVEVIVSTGIERVVMPDLAGLSLTDARLRLGDAGLGGDVGDDGAVAIRSARPWSRRRRALRRPSLRMAA